MLLVVGGATLPVVRFAQTNADSSTAVNFAI